MTILAFDEINAMTRISMDQAEQEGDSARLLDDVEAILIDAYVKGVKAAGEMLGEDLDVDVILMMETIELEIDGKTYKDRLIDYFNGYDTEAAQRVVETEAHRVANAGIMDGANAFIKSSGKSVMKVWNTMLDDRVRETHDYLEQTAVPLTAEFYTIDGDHAPYPGAFQDAANNVNCRCFLSLTIA